MPLNIGFEGKLLGLVPHPLGKHCILVVLAENEIAKKKEMPLFQWLSQLRGNKAKALKCNDNCVTIRGAARYYLTSGNLICDEIWSDGLGPLMLLVLAKLAHDKGLTLVARGPLSQDAENLLHRMLAEPIRNLTVQNSHPGQFIFTFQSNAEIDTAIQSAIVRFFKHLEVDSDNELHKKYKHTAEGLGESAADTYLSKAALAHHSQY